MFKSKLNLINTGITGKIKMGAAIEYPNGTTIESSISRTIYRDDGGKYFIYIDDSVFRVDKCYGDNDDYRLFN